MTHFNWLLDGSIVGLYLLATMVAGVMVRKYVARVDHFLVAGREMNVYLGIASLAATEFGIVTAMYTAQAGYTRGFAGAIPGICNAIAMYVIGWTGFCVKPLRDSGAITIPELFEKHYGKFVRWLAGVVIVLGGLLNMGVFLRVGGQFLVVCCGLNLRYLEVTMTVMLIGVAVYTIMGGMLSVLVTDFLQFVVMSVGLLVVSFLIVDKVGWNTLVEVVDTKYGAGGFNPFLNRELGWAFVLSNLITNTATVLTWQTCIARLLAAKDSQTGCKVYTGTAFFFVCRWMIPGLWGIAALALVPASIVDSIGLQFGETDGTLFAMPYLLGTLVPAGMMGLLVAAMLAADMSTDSSYMLTWGSVIYNDIMGPFRKQAWSESRGLLWNRCIVGLIGVFLLFWGLWYKLEGNLWEYLQTTGTIYLASMSVLLIACCYWKPANDWGAIAAIVVGAALPVLALSLNLFVKVPVYDAAGLPVLKDGQQTLQGCVAYCLGDNFVNIASYAAAALAMVGGSLIKPLFDIRGVPHALYGELPWFRRAWFASLLLLAGIFLPPLLWTLCILCLTGEIYTQEKGDDDCLIIWSPGRKIVVAGLLVVQVVALTAGLAWGLAKAGLDPPFWAVMTIAVLVWYSTVTIYVAVRGSLDIKQMLRRLQEGAEEV